MRGLLAKRGNRDRVQWLSFKVTIFISSEPRITDGESAKEAQPIFPMRDHADGENAGSEERVAVAEQQPADRISEPGPRLGKLARCRQ